MGYHLMVRGGRFIMRIIGATTTTAAAGVRQESRQEDSQPASVVERREHGCGWLEEDKRANPRA